MTRPRDSKGRFAATAEPVKPTAEGLVLEIAGTSNDFMRQVGVNGIMTNTDEVMTTIAPSKLSKNGQLTVDPYRLHRQMRRADLKYKALIAIRKKGVLGKQWRVVPNPADNDPKRAAEVAAFSQAALLRIKKFHADLRELLEAIPSGWAISETMWHQITIVYGEGKSRLGWTPKSLDQRRQGRFDFAEDWSLRYQPSPGTYVPVHPHKFIVHSHAVENEDRHGTGEASEVWWWWFLKHNFIKWWSVFGEKFSQPTVQASYPPGTPQTEIDKLKRAIKMFQTEFGLTIPNNVEVKLLEAQRYGSINTYQSFSEFCDKCMSEALTGQSLATGQGEGGNGSRAASEVHAGQQQIFTEDDCQELMDTIDEDLMCPLAYWNFGPDVPHALFVIDYEAKDLAGDLTQDTTLVNEIGFPMTYGYFADKYKRPLPPGVDRDDLVPGRKIAAPAAPFGGGGAGDGEDDFGAARRHGKTTNRIPPKGGTPNKVSFNAVEFAKGSKKRRAEAELCTREADRLSEKIVELGREAYNAIADAVAAAADKCDDLDELKARVELLKGKHVEQLASGIATAKANGYLLGAAQMYRALAPVIEDSEKHSAHFAKKKLGEFDPMPPTEAIKWFEELVPLTKEDLAKVAREATAKAYTIAGIEDRDVIKRVQDKVSEYLKEGKTLADWKQDYGQIREEAGLDPVKGYQAEATFRDSTHRAYGAGRVRTANAPEVREHVWGYEYMATMDDRTRPEHAALNGFTAERDDPFWVSHTPPWEYGCRCVAVAVTKLAAELEGIEAKGTVEVDGVEVDPRTWPASPGFRGLGFGAGCGHEQSDLREAA